MCVQNLPSAHKWDAHTSGRMRPLPNSGRVICMSLKPGKVFAPSGRSWGERDKKELQNGNHHRRDETKEMWTRQEWKCTAGNSKRMYPFLLLAGVSWRFLFCSSSWALKEQKSSFILKHNTIKNITLTRKMWITRLDTQLRAPLGGWKVMRTFKEPEV